MRKGFWIALSLALVVSLVFAQHHSQHPSQGPVPPGMLDAMRAVNADHIRADDRFLASDLLEGRGTGARGGDIAAEFIADQFAIAGLEPAGDNGTYLQRVPMVGITTEPGTTLQVVTPKQTLDLRMLDDVVIMDESQQKQSDLDSDVIFMGYGITAPEYGWDDYAGVDVRGKVLLMLVNEPPSDDPTFFAGKALTFYGRWVYKYEQAARMGAAGVILIHQTEMASYGWSVVRNSWSGERARLANDGEPQLHLASWVQFDLARTLLADSGRDLDQLILQAGQRGFKPIAMPLRVKAHIVNTVRPFQASNVIGRIPGSDPALRDQAIIFTGHYDHLGIRPEMKGDNIYNGALDNGTGSAMMLEIARALMAAPVKPRRSVYVVCVTAEEQGLWGSEYLVRHPPVPLDRISLNMNFDMVPPFGLPREVEANGYERTSVAPLFEKVATDLKLKVVEAGNPGSGGYFRSDHFSFARHGVPAFSINTGGHFDGHPEEWVKKKQQDEGRDYHQPSDEFREDFDFRANAVMARFAIALAYWEGTQPRVAQWKPGDEFEARRKAQFKQ